MAQEISCVAQRLTLLTLTTQRSGFYASCFNGGVFLHMWKSCRLLANDRGIFPFTSKWFLFSVTRSDRGLHHRNCAKQASKWHHHQYKHLSVKVIMYMSNAPLGNNLGENEMWSQMYELFRAMYWHSMPHYINTFLHLDQSLWLLSPVVEENATIA